MNEEMKQKIIENMTRNLPTLRAKAALSQARLAEMIGVSTGGLDHVVGAAHVPVEAVLVLPGHIAGVVEAVPPVLGGLLLVALVAVAQTAGQTVCMVLQIY